jgi:hypothetical protein
MNLFRDDREYQEYKTQPPMEALRDLAYDMGLPRINRGVVKVGKAVGRGALRAGRWVKDRVKGHGVPRLGRIISDYLNDDDDAPQKNYSSPNTEMNELKQQIVYMRQAMFSKGMTKELEGFDTAIRLFADTKKKSFKQKLSEGWQKHKGKILAGAALAAAGGAGLWGYNQKKEADKYKANYLALGISSASLNAQYKQKVSELESQLKSAKAEYNATSEADSKTKKELESRISRLQKQLLQMRNAAQKAQIEADKAKKDLEAEKNKGNVAPAGTNLATGGGKGKLSTSEFDPVATRTDHTPYGTTPASSYIPL